MSNLKRQVLVRTGGNTDWVQARELVKDKGGLPSNVLLDRILVKEWPTIPEEEKRILRLYFPAWTREVLVYPKHGKEFRKGKDIVDNNKYGQKR